MVAPFLTSSSDFLSSSFLQILHLSIVFPVSWGLLGFEWVFSDHFRNENRKLGVFGASEKEVLEVPERLLQRRLGFPGDSDQKGTGTMEKHHENVRVGAKTSR